MKPQCYDEILYRCQYGSIYKLGGTILFETRYSVDEHEFIMGFNADWIPESQHVWFCSVCGKQYMEQMQAMRICSQLKQKRIIKEALGL